MNMHSEGVAIETRLRYLGSGTPRDHQAMRHGRTIDTVQMTEGQFLAWVEPLDRRYELVDGLPVVRPSSTREHERVAKCVFVALLTQVDATVLDFNKSDFGVRIRQRNGKHTVLYPDVLVDAQSDDGAAHATETPLVVVEVLPNGGDYDLHVVKLERYKACPTLKHYVVFEQCKAKAYVWNETEAGWSAQPRIVEGSEARVLFPHIGAEIRLGDVYVALIDRKSNRRSAAVPDRGP